jgi:CheY-like chemotaxis protein
MEQQASSKPEQVTVGGSGSRGSACSRREEIRKERGGSAAAAAAKDGARVVPVDDGGGRAEVVVVEPPCVIAVDDSSVDRAIVTALLRRSKYRGQAPLPRSFSFLSVWFIHKTPLKKKTPCDSVDAVTAVDSGKRALEILGSVRRVLNSDSIRFVHSLTDGQKQNGFNLCVSFSQHW